MGAWTWKAKQLFRKALPFLVVFALGYGVVHGWAGRGARRAVVSVLRHVPIIGSRFAARPRYSSYQKRYRGARKHYRGQGRRSRHSRRWR